MSSIGTSTLGISKMYNPWDEIKVPEKNILSRRVKSDHPLNLFWARDQYGFFLFVYSFTSSEDLPDKLPLLNGITIHLLEPPSTQESSYMLVLKLNDKNDWQMFLALCNDLTGATSNVEHSKKATLVILRRLMRWQEFLQQKRLGLLSERIIKGMIGELLFLFNRLKPAFGLPQAIQFWQGPDDLPQDFNVENCAVEVKCQLGTTSPKVKISSADQLCTQLPNMYLHVITLGKTDFEDEKAINLPFLVSSIRDELEIASANSLERFNNLLYQTGYIDSDEYLQYSYILVSEETYRVEEGFPRICSEHLPLGVDKVSYDISLHDCVPFIASPKWMINL